MRRNRVFHIVVLVLACSLFVFARRGQAAQVYKGIPTLEILHVEKDTRVTVRTHNFPPHQVFSIKMGAMGSQGVSGIQVGSLESGDGGSMTASYDIPEALAGMRQIAIRAQTNHMQPYFAYNWFYNQGEEAAEETVTEETEAGSATADSAAESDSTTATPTDESAETSAEEIAATDDSQATESESEDVVDPSTIPAQLVPYWWEGPPAFEVCEVVEGESALFSTYQFPPEQNFVVRIGKNLTQGYEGVVVATFESNYEEYQLITVPIPKSLQGERILAIRVETTHAVPIYAYNWFYNRTAIVC